MHGVWAFRPECVLNWVGLSDLDRLIDFDRFRSILVDFGRCDRLWSISLYVACFLTDVDVPTFVLSMFCRSERAGTLGPYLSRGVFGLWCVVWWASDGDLERGDKAYLAHAPGFWRRRAEQCTRVGVVFWNMCFGVCFVFKSFSRSPLEYDFMNSSNNIRQRSYKIVYKIYRYIYILYTTNKPNKPNKSNKQTFNKPQNMQNKQNNTYSIHTNQTKTNKANNTNKNKHKTNKNNLQLTKHTKQHIQHIQQSKQTQHNNTKQTKQTIQHTK